MLGSLLKGNDRVFVDRLSHLCPTLVNLSEGKQRRELQISSIFGESAKSLPNCEGDDEGRTKVTK